MHVRPERVYVWPGGDASAEPELLDSHMEEVRSGHDEEPDARSTRPRAAAPVWDGRMDELGERYRAAVLSLVSPDGFPFSVRVPIDVDRSARLVRLGAGRVGRPGPPGRACLTVHDHGPRFEWQRNFQVRGDLVERDGDWVLVPHRLVGGFELPPGLDALALPGELPKILRFRKIAKRELRQALKAPRFPQIAGSSTESA